MCGIVGYLGQREAIEVLLDGLKRLEYRGYDSAGVAILADGQVHTTTAVGKLACLEGALQDCRPLGSVGIGHTRWATHGEPTVINAHPHLDCLGRIAVVHNGIIENHLQLRNDLQAKGHRFK
jgi:glutamine---fructose-6-phosphate transaminase (isomerizing)